MPKSYSTDFRWHVVWLHVFMKKSAQEVSQLLLLSTRIVQIYCQKFMFTGNLEPQQHRSCPRSILSNSDEPMLVNGSMIVPLSVACLNYLELLANKSCTLPSKEVNKSEGSSWQKRQWMFVWCDESGCDRRKPVRDREYGITGIPPRDHTSGKQYSVIAVRSIYRWSWRYLHQRRKC